ncbi:ATP-binding cassette domain-containing protein [Vagococcus sp. JNUCC 83]
MLTAKNISFKYHYSDVLTNISATFELGSMYAIIGKSGSGKTTLLSLLSGLSSLQDGDILFEGTSLKQMNLRQYRKNCGIVFQSFNLINYLTPIQNIILALDIQGYKGNKKKKAKEMLKKVDITNEQMTRKCAELSGGQQQRIAIARAIASDDKIIFADEPTGSLDTETSQLIIKLLKDLAHQEQKCVICVTHDLELEKIADITYRISNGKLYG